MGNILANSISNIPHFGAFDELAAERLNSIDLNPLLVYMIDTVPASALPFLAAQFHVTGYEGLRFATTEAQQRELIKSAIELHRYKGTPWAVKESLKPIGINYCEIEEGLGFFYNGGAYYNGSIFYGGAGNWPTFRVIIDVSNLGALDAAFVNDMRILINEYKNVRSWLIDVSLLISETEDVSYSDELDDGSGYIESLARGILYNGGGAFNGANNYNKGDDVLEVTIFS